MHRRTTLVTSLATAVATGALLAPSASAETYKATKEYRGASVKLTVTTRADGTARLKTTNNLPVKCGDKGRIKFQMNIVVTPEEDGSFTATNRENVNLKVPGKGTARERYTGTITEESAKVRFRTKVNGEKADCSADIRWNAKPTS